MEGSQAHTKPVTDVEASRAIPTETRITRPLYIGMQPESRNQTGTTQFAVFDWETTLNL